MRYLFIIFTLTFLLVSVIADAQDQKESSFPEYAEEMDDPYVPVNKSLQSKSPAYYFAGPNILTVQVNINEGGENIIGDAANEPSIAIDPTNPDFMVIGWRQFDDVDNNFRQAGNAYTIDGGLSWVNPGVIDPGVFRSDPVLDFSSPGQIYYNSLTLDAQSNYQCDVYQSTGPGTWDDGVFAYGGDKQWMVVDRSGGQGDGHIYANWKAGLSNCPPRSFTRSIDGGLSFEECVSTLGEPVRGTLSVGPDGELYAFGQVGNDFVLAKSTTAKDPMNPVSWDFSETIDLGGPIGLYAGPNPSGMLAQGWVATDHSDGETRGNVYVLCSIKPDISNDPVDVMFARSTDGGQSWSEPVRINDDLSETNWQWFGTLSVAPNGRIDVVWLDTRLDPGGYGSALFYSHSQDGGLTWSPNQQLSDVFDPHLGWPNQQKMGDYFHMISDNEGAHLAWAATFTGGQDVYYSYITPELINTSSQVQQAGNNLETYPNPFSNLTTITYTLESTARVDIQIYSSQGQLVETLEEGRKTTGRYTLNFNGAHLPDGVYVCKLMVNGALLGQKRMVKMAG